MKMRLKIWFYKFHKKAEKKSYFSKFILRLSNPSFVPTRNLIQVSKDNAPVKKKKIFTFISHSIIVFSNFGLALYKIEIANKTGNKHSFRCSINLVWLDYLLNTWQYQLTELFGILKNHVTTVFWFIFSITLQRYPYHLPQYYCVYWEIQGVLTALTVWVTV